MPLFLDLKVMTQSGRIQLVVDKTGRLRCYIKAAPEKGKANQQVIALIAQQVGVANRDVEIVAGLTSRNKRVRVEVDMTLEQFLSKLGVDQQRKIF